MSPDLPPWAVELLYQSRVARLGTADRTGRPLVVPVCYAFDGRACVTAIDAKPKRVPGRRLRRVRNIEENPRAVHLGRLNARISSARVEYMPGKVEKALKQVRLGQHQAVILDPPRAGCEPEALAELIRLGADRVVYVSCEPSTHARDIAGLVRGGYRVRRAAIVDMFPQTYHIESVALLERF